jgi:hypothetical protein
MLHKRRAFGPKRRLNAMQIRRLLLAHRIGLRELSESAN